MNKAQRLKEYGMHIRKNQQGTYNLGVINYRGVAKFTTYDDAYDAFEQIVDRFWEFHGDNFHNLAQSMLPHIDYAE